MLACSVYLALREYRRMFQGKILVFCASFVLLLTDFLAVLKRVIRYFEITKMNRLWLTHICLYRLFIP